MWQLDVSTNGWCRMGPAMFALIVIFSAGCNSIATHTPVVPLGQQLAFSVAMTQDSDGSLFAECIVTNCGLVPVLIADEWSLSWHFDGIPRPSEVPGAFGGGTPHRMGIAPRKFVLLEPSRRDLPNHVAVLECSIASKRIRLLSDGPAKVVKSGVLNMTCKIDCLRGIGERSSIETVHWERDSAFTASVFP